MQEAHGSSANAPHLKRAQVRVVTVFFMIYILVAGGSFGIEDMISSSGPGLTLLMLLLLPLFWSLPASLVASELGSAIPGEGGFYVWTRRALGDFWGFQAAWWWLLAVFVDSAVYIVLAVNYLQNWLDFSDAWYYIVCWSMIGVFALMNVVGVQLVAMSSVLFSLLILAPFAVLVVVGFAQWQFNPLLPVVPPDTPLFGTGGALAHGLAVGIWMYSGYESISTLSGEIRNPQKIIPRALMLVLPFIVISYILPTVAALAAYGNWELFAVDADGEHVSFIEVARFLGGPWLGVAMLVSAVLGNLALYLDYLASGARPMFAVAADGLFPRSMSRVSRRFGTPVVAIVVMALVNAVLVIGPFRSLVVIDVMLFILTYVMIFIAVVRLRIREPELKRPFRIPLGVRGLVAMVIPPTLIVIATIYLNVIDRSTELFGTNGFNVLGLDVGWLGIAGALAVASGTPFYYLFRAIYGGPRTPSAEAGAEAIALAEADAAEEAGIHASCMRGE